MTGTLVPQRIVPYSPFAATDSGGAAAAATITDVTLSPHYADKTGVTDSTVRIQAALDVGNQVYFPPGTYAVSAPLKFRDQQTIYSDNAFSVVRGATIIMTGAFAIFESVNKTTANVRNVHIHDLNLNNAGVNPVGSKGIDFSNVSYSQITRISARSHQYGIYASSGAPYAFDGHYNSVRDVEIASCTIGLELAAVANSWLVEGGRHFGNGTGIETACVTGTFVGIAVEKCGIGYRFTSGASANNVFGGHVEGSTVYGVQFAGSAHSNYVYGTSLSNSENPGGSPPNWFRDSVRDDSNTGRNYILSENVPSPYSGITGHASGQNLIPNSGFEVDSNADGLADHWVLSAGGLPGGMSFSLDAATIKSGTVSQKYAISGASGVRNISIELDVRPNGTYVFSGWVRTDVANAYRYGIGLSPLDPGYQSYLFYFINEWQYQRIVFTVGATSAIYLWFKNENATVVSNLWLSGLRLEAGSTPTAWENDALGTRKVTWGAPLASVGTVVPTHALHMITGAGAINNIGSVGGFQLAGFAGSVTLVLDLASTATFTAAGNIAAAPAAVAGRAYTFHYNTTNAKWYCNAQ